MKIFISSLISGMELLRAAVRDAITQLGHEAVMAEDFGALPTTPQVACLTGLRQSALAILVLGANYGAKQASGLSATHEEYRDAQGQRPVIAFVQQGASPDADETAFVREVQAWESGLFRGGFSSPEELRAHTTRAIHEWELSNAAGPVDGPEMLARALSALPLSERQHRQRGATLAISIASGPQQSILRPSEMERADLAEGLMQASLFGPTKIFSPSVSTRHAIENHALCIRQDEDRGAIRLDGEGSVLITSSLEAPHFGPVIIQEDITQRLAAALRYADWLLDHVDPTQRLTHFAIAAAIAGTESVVWRTRAEQNASPNSYSMGWRQSEPAPVHLSPPQRPRSAIKLSANQIVEDLVTLLRREWSGSRN